METKEKHQAKPTLEELLIWYGVAYEDARPLIAEVNRLKAEIVRRVRDRRQTVENENVRATYRAGHKRVTWDSKALDGFAAAHPEILPFRKESWTAPSVSIKLLD